MTQYLPKILLLLTGLLIALVWTGRIGIYLSNYKPFNLEINGKPNRKANKLLRKLKYLVISLLTVLALSGAAFKTGLLDQANTEVGRVMEKYTLEEDGSFAMFCTIELCKSRQTRKYQVCCSTNT